MAALQEKKSCSQRMEEFQHYCWNPDTGQLLGRTLSRWGMWPAGNAALVGYVLGKDGKGGAALRQRQRTTHQWLRAGWSRLPELRSCPDFQIGLSSLTRWPQRSILALKPSGTRDLQGGNI